MKTFFAIIYNFYLKPEGKNDALFRAVLYVSGLIWFNLFALINILNVKYIPGLNYSFYWLFILLCVIIACSYFAFIHRKKHLQILEAYNRKSKQQKTFYKIILFLYAILSLAILIYTAVLIRAINLS
jgi:hypothetical protein